MDEEDEYDPEAEDEEAAEFTLARSHAETLEELDLAAMVDVAFQLVLFFLVTASTIVFKTLEVPRPTPEKKAGAAGQGTPNPIKMEDAQESWILVDIDDNGQFKVDRENGPIRLQRPGRQAPRPEEVERTDGDAADGQRGHEAQIRGHRLRRRQRMQPQDRPGPARRPHPRRPYRRPRRRGSEFRLDGGPGVKIAMTTRRWLAAIAAYAVILWVAVALGRTLPIRPHLLPVSNIPGIYMHTRLPTVAVLAEVRGHAPGPSMAGQLSMSGRSASQIIEYAKRVDTRRWEPGCTSDTTHPGKSRFCLHPPTFI